jgi:hypothetical protein
VSSVNSLPNKDFSKEMEGAILWTWQISEYNMRGELPPEKDAMKGTITAKKGGWRFPDGRIQSPVL